jgi:hypothetical protein
MLLTHFKDEELEAWGGQIIFPSEAEHIRSDASL